MVVSSLAQQQPWNKTLNAFVVTERAVGCSPWCIMARRSSWVERMPRKGPGPGWSASRYHGSKGHQRPVGPHSSPLLPGALVRWSRARLCPHSPGSALSPAARTAPSPCPCSTASAQALPSPGQGQLGTRLDWYRHFPAAPGSPCPVPKLHQGSRSLHSAAFLLPWRSRRPATAGLQHGALLSQSTLSMWCVVVGATDLMHQALRSRCVTSSGWSVSTPAT